MATANGTRTPPDGPTLDHAAVAATPAEKSLKRDRDLQSEDITKVDRPRGNEIQRDILDLLEPHDTTPSFLKHALEHHNATTERSPKKPRLSNPSNDHDTIASKLSIGAYSSLHDLRKDAEHVTESLHTSVRAKAKDREGQNGRMLVDDLKQMQRAQAFENFIKNVVEQEVRYDALHGAKSTGSQRNGGHTPNGLTSSVSQSDSATVLTLFGNAPTPKQLFSSLQRAPRDGNESAVKTELPVEEISLPTGLSATKILEPPSDEKQKIATFEEAFPPPYNLPALQPPKSQRRPTTRDETLKWEFKDPLAARNKKGGYTVQSLTVGDWLGYGGVDSQDEPSSPREKRKMRDRALSGGESSQTQPSTISLQETLAKEEEALFRKAYSGFAPSYDNSKALVPEEVKSMVWWHKVGQRQYRETFAIDPALLDETPPSVLDLLSPSNADEQDFSSVVEDLDMLDDEESSKINKEVDHGNVDAILAKISGLLETLASYQRVRNASLQSSSAAARPSISPSPTLSSRTARTDLPDADELVTYRKLQRELSDLILRLPPYAVAKLNGDRFAELGVSRLIPIGSKVIKGTMEEDTVARLAKYTQQATAQGIATLTRGGSSTQHYSSANQRTPAIGQQANTRYGQQYGMGRTPVTQPQYNRNISNHSTYGTPTAGGQRPGYTQPNQYTRPVAPQANGQQPFRQMPQSTPTYPGYHPSTQQAKPAYPLSQSQPLAQFQQRSAQHAAAYQASNSQSPAPPTHATFQRTASPLKPANYQPPLQPSPVPRPQQQFQPPAPSPSPALGSDRATPVSYPSEVTQTPAVNGVAQQPQQQQQQQQQQQKPAAPSPVTQSVQANGHV